MDAALTITNQELGHRLTQVREAAGLKQAELARRITWSSAVFSRVESAAAVTKERWSRIGCCGIFATTAD